MDDCEKESASSGRRSRRDDWPEEWSVPLLLACHLSA